MKKVLTILLALTFIVGAFAGCNNQGFDPANEISVVSREDGSGTRGAFVELFGIEEKDDQGNKVDRTTEEATVVNSTEVMMTTVSGNQYAIGYASLGSLNDTIKAIPVDGAEPTVDNVKNDTYKISRPFNIATTSDVSDAAQDFINFILSADGQKVVEENGYIPLDTTESFTSSKPTDKDKIVIAGSSSITPVMEKLKEAYNEINPDITIEVQQSDSSTGMQAAIDGTCDIGMASRELKDSELENLTATEIAIDGIAIIVNNENTLESITSEQVKNIFTGTTTSWDEIITE